MIATYKVDITNLMYVTEDDLKALMFTVTKYEGTNISIAVLTQDESLRAADTASFMRLRNAQEANKLAAKEYAELSQIDSTANFDYMKQFS